MRFLSSAACCSLNTNGPNSERYCRIANAGWYSGNLSSSFGIAVTVDIARSRMDCLLSECLVFGLLV